MHARSTDQQLFSYQERLRRCHRQSRRRPYQGYEIGKYPGGIDNNVHPANIIRVINAIIKANKRFDFLMLPGQRHSYGDMDEYFFYRLADYFSEWLLKNTHRSEVDIVQMNND